MKRHIIRHGLLGALLLGCTVVAAPPSGRPPIGPLKREEPKVYDLTFMVQVGTVIQQTADEKGRHITQPRFDLADAPIMMPLVFQGTYSRVDPTSVTASLWLDGKQVSPEFEIKEGLPFNSASGVITLRRFNGLSLRWQMGYRVQVWSSRIDDSAAAQIAWPREWPSEVQDGLKPQMFIESNDPIFKETVDRVSEGKLRLVPPYLAAKDLIRYAINNIQTVGDGTDFGAHGQIRGLIVNGAKKAATDGRGSPHDLVCVCVAMLRAAEIPARPVIGVQTHPKTGRKEFVSWAEFYMAECGWIPFDPYVMRGKGIRSMDVRRPWPEFGSMKDLNERVPLAYHFIPAASVQTPRNAAVWGWDPRPGGGANSDQVITLGVVSRGRGIDDPS